MQPEQYIRTYSLENLKAYCSKNEITLLENYTTAIKIYTQISGSCMTKNCPGQFRKTFYRMLTHGGYCKPCMNKIRIKKSQATSMANWNTKFPMQSQEVKNKIMATNRAHRGHDWPFQSKVVQEKMQATCIEKYGKPNPSQSEEIKAKKDATNMRVRGVKNPSQSDEVKLKKKITTFKNFGVEYSMQSPLVREKSMATCRERYNVDHACQNPEILNKAIATAFKSKDYTLPSGKVIKIQGYEHFALNELLKTYSENDIVIGCENVPEINYIGDNNIKRKHFADIYIPAEKLMIEVKSTWTLLKSNVIIKMLAAQNEGFTYHFWIYNYKGEKVTCENLEETEAFVKILTNKFINNAFEY